MCDFRKINSIKINGTDTIIPVEVKHCHVNYMQIIEDPGFYHIAASGGFYSYFTGNKWLSEHLDYEVIDFSTNYPSGLFYDFIH